jgi:hypothetical protein
MNELSNDERLLRYYAETERIIHGPVRGAIHRHCYAAATSNGRAETLQLPCFDGGASMRNQPKNPLDRLFQNVRSALKGTQPQGSSK